MFKFITNRPLWVNILAGILLGLGVFAAILLSLDWITSHGKASTVPSVAGKNYEEAREILKKAGFKVEIQDSVCVDTVKPLTVIKQIPDADEVVKSHRTVFLIISRAVPPLVEMPNLLGYSFRNAEMVLKNMDLKIGDTTFKPDFAKNAILEQWYNGTQINPGTKIGEAKKILESNGIVIGAIVTDANVTDTLAAWIYKQNPERFDDEKRIQRIRSGQTIDVWLQVDKPAKADSTDTKTILDL